MADLNHNSTPGRIIPEKADALSVKFGSELGSIAQTILKEKDPQQKDMLRRAYRETEKIIKPGRNSS
jgi:hypothetical protein